MSKRRSSPARPAATASRARSGWLPKALIALIAPLAFLALAEGALRAIGYGHPTSYLVPASHDPERWVENPHFGRPHFPAGLLRVPPPTSIARRKPDGTVRILLFGESAAMGDPKPAFGVARHLEVLLRERFAPTPFEVIPLAMTAINSHALVPMARQGAALDADYWIVFAGNNEMLGPFGAGTVLGRKAPPWWWVRASLAARSTRLGQALEATVARLRGSASGSSQWAGVRVLASDSIAGDVPERARVQTSFQRNLRDIVRAGQSSGAQVLLSSVAVNLRDCGPFGSLLRPDLPAAQREEWTRHYESGRTALASENATAAIESFSQARSLDDSHAALHFESARAWTLQSDSTLAAAAYQRAVDRDTIPLRTDAPLNAIIRQVATETSAGFIDSAAALAERSPEGVAGSEWFYEHVHFTPEGNDALARLFGDALLPLLPEPVRTRDAGSWISPEASATRLALTPWARSAAVEIMLRRCVDAPFTNRVNHAEQIDLLAAEAARQRRALTPETARFVRGIFTNAVASAPSDHHLRRSHAEFLEAIGDLNGAIAEWDRVREWLPHHPVAWLQAGSLRRLAGRPDDAQPLIERAVALQPDWPEAHLELTEVFLARGRPAQAIPAALAAVRLQPDQARAHIRLAHAYGADRRTADAIASLETAVSLDPASWEARYLLGVEYAMQDRLEPAREQFAETLRLRPDHARAQFNLGIALARLQRWPEAAHHLAEAVRLNPRDEDAKRALAEVIVRGRSP
ncbi:MAG: tetratricopeptide repeat protein [Verrucomicrobiae bacterium]|nr:tetratricopeptide repeat protein [Verrucomicrobiae bacterium]